jgi:hypothetical protein
LALLRWKMQVAAGIEKGRHNGSASGDPDARRGVGAFWLGEMQQLGDPRLATQRLMQRSAMCKVGSGLTVLTDVELAALVARSADTGRLGRAEGVVGSLVNPYG